MLQSSRKKLAVPLFSGSVLLLAAPIGCLGQNQPDTTASVFEAGVVSTGHEFTLTFSPDGNTAYFTRGFSDPRRNHVMRTRFLDGEWQPAARVSFSTDDWSDLDPSVSPDGERLYFVSTRPKAGSTDSTGPDMDIWFAVRAGTDWGRPVHVPVVNSPAKEGSPTLSSDGTLCFFSDRNAEPNENAIYCAAADGDSFSPPVKLGPEINAGSTTSPFLSQDGSTLLFYSTRDGGYGGGDLYVSFRNDGRWSPARNLGPVVNTDDWEYNPSVSRDGKTLYFGRARNIDAIALKAVRVEGLVPERFTAE